MNLDVIVMLLALVLGLSPVVIAVKRSRLGNMTAPALAVILFSIAGVGVGTSLVHSHSVTTPEPVGPPKVLKADQYVGSDTCQSCHPYEHATWHASYHRTMTQLADPASIRAPFDGTALELEGVTWRLERRGDEFWVRGKDATREVEKRIVMATGSHNYQLYWMESDGRSGLYQFPLVYLLHDKLWIPRKARFLQPPIEHTPIETGRWKMHCIKCHATHGQKEHLPGGETRVAELGISCEACHGPGAAHVSANRTPLRRYTFHLSGKADPTIINPRRLPHDRATQVCAQCHGIEIFLDSAKAEDWAHMGTRFRPGDDLSKFQTMVGGRYEDNPPEVQQYLDRSASFRLRFCFWSDGTLRVTGREYHGMMETPCYQRGDMSCLSCHTLHRATDDPRPFSSWADDQLGVGMDSDRACTQCHKEYENRDVRVAHSHHLAESTGSTCYNCHMPYTTWGLLRAIRSHTVESPNVATSISTGRPNGCNQCHVDQTLQWTADKLQEWYGIEPPQLSNDEQNIAASVLWTLRGDPGQRALMAWSMGWKPAREISGTEWMVPYLTALLMDPYHAVRFNAQRSLRAYPAYSQMTADGVTGATHEQQTSMMHQILRDWESTFPNSKEKKKRRLLANPDGRMDRDSFRRLAQQRDNTVMVLFE